MNKTGVFSVMQDRQNIPIKRNRKVHIALRIEKGKQGAFNSSGQADAPENRHNVVLFFGKDIDGPKKKTLVAS